MAIIYSYPKVTSPLATDVLVLTDTTLAAGKRKNKTKSLALSDLAAYVVSSTSAITGSGTLNTIPLFTPSGVKLGDSIITQAVSGQGVTITGQLDVTEDFNVTGSTELSDTLTVGGVATFNADVECNNNVTVQGVFAADGNSVFSGSVTIDEQLIDGTGSSGTAGQVLSSTGTGVEWISDAGGSVTGTGINNYFPIWTDGPNGVIGDSQLRQSSQLSNSLYQIRMENTDRFIINKPSSVISGDPAFQIAQDGDPKVEFGWDDDGGGYGFLYNYKGLGWRFGAAGGNNPELEITTTAGSEGVTITNNLTINGSTTTAGDLLVESGLIDGDSTYGTAGQVLSTTGTGQNVKWIDAPSGGTAIVPGQRQGYIISVTNKTVGSPDFDTTSLCTNVVYNRQVSSSLNWSEYGKQWTPSFDNGYDAGGTFASSVGVFSMLEESVKDVLATTGNSAVANFRFQIMSYDNWMLASHEMPLAVRVDNNGASPGNGTALIKLVEEVTPKTGPPDLPSTVCVWFVDTTDTSSNMGGPIPTIVFAGKDTAYAKIVNGGNQYDAGATYTFTGNTGDTTRKYALLIEDEYYSNMRSKYLKVTGGRVVLENLPTSDPSSNGVVWNDSGTLKISAG